MLQPAVKAIGGRPDSDRCKIPLLLQAGFVSGAGRAKLENLKMLADAYCTSFKAGESENHKWILVAFGIMVWAVASHYRPASETPIKWHFATPIKWRFASSHW